VRGLNGCLSAARSSFSRSSVKRSQSTYETASAPQIQIVHGGHWSQSRRPTAKITATLRYPNTINPFTNPSAMLYLRLVIFIHLLHALKHSSGDFDVFAKQASMHCWISDSLGCDVICEENAAPHLTKEARASNAAMLFLAMAWNATTYSLVCAAMLMDCIRAISPLIQVHSFVMSVLDVGSGRAARASKYVGSFDVAQPVPTTSATSRTVRDKFRIREAYHLSPRHHAIGYTTDGALS